jgi:hypothetical protein
MPGVKAITAAAVDLEAIEGRRSLEVRWILPGHLPAATARWFGRFPAEVAAREDSYLLDPALGTVSVKLRAGRLLEMKVYYGRAGTFHPAGGARGRPELWRKWSFPAGLPVPAGGCAADWTIVSKRRRIIRFWLAGGRIAASIPPPAAQAACAVELTDIGSDRGPWWTLGFEATGPDSFVRQSLDATAAVMFAQPLPRAADLGPSQCQSYAQWLRNAPTEHQALMRARTRRG